MRRLASFLTATLFVILALATASAQTCTSPSGVPVTMCSPANGATVASPVHEQVATNIPNHTVQAIYTYVDNVVVRKDYNVRSVDAYVTIATGAHNIRVQVWDGGGNLYQAGANITVGAGTSCTSPSGVVITMCSPADGSTVSSPVHEQVATNDPGHTVKAIYTYVDNVVVRKDYNVTSVDALVPIATGAHNIRVQMWDDVAGVVYKAGSNITVTSGGSTCTSPSGVAITMCSPVDGSTVSSPVHELVATNDPGHAVKAIYTYVDNVVVRKDYNVTSVDAQVPIAAGAHNIRVQMWDDVAGVVYKAGSNITVTSGSTISVSVSPASATVLAGKTQQFTASVSNASNTTVTWSVDGVAGGNSTVGTVDSTGLYTAPAAAGNHTVTATSVQDTSKTGSAAVTVTTASVVVSPATANVAPGQTQQFTAQVSNTSNQAVTWEVDGTTGGSSTAGTISTSGLYTAPAATGTHTIGAISQADPTQSGTATVHVTAFSGIFTYHNDNQVTGLNANETVLTPANVNSTQFGKLFTRALDGYVFAQPLYVPNLNIPGKGTFNVVYVATEHDSVYAFDADGAVSSALWHRSFIDSSAAITTISSSAINNADEGPEVGVTSTPVIDASTNTIYVVAATDENGVYHQRLHALDITTGAEKFGGPVSISGSVSGTGRGSVNGVLTFDPLIENQRAALLLANGNIYIGFASHGDQGNNHGWLFAYKASDLSRVALWCATPNDWDGGIWGSGAGPAADSSGNIFVVTANGNFNLNSGGKNASDTYLRMSSTLGILDYFTPYNQSALNSGDLDVGASGVLLVPDAQTNTTHVHLAIGSNKSGDLYVIDRDNMGHYQSSSNTNIVQYLPRALGANSSGDQYFGVGAYWNGNLYLAGSYDHLKQFTLSDGLLSATPVHQSPEVVATYRSARPVVSSNGTSNAIVWLISTDSGASTPTLRAYDATNIGHELYSSTQNASRDTPTGGILKFNSPTIANGKVFFSAQKNLNVYGLLQP